MRNLMLVGLIGMFGMLSTGCVAVASKSTRYGVTREVVAVDGRVYIIDVGQGTAREVDLGEAKPFDPTEYENDNDK